MKLEWIQALRALAALLVLGLHLGQQETRFLEAAISPVFAAAGMSGVDLFFVISGFVMVWVTRHAPHGSAGFSARFLYARITRIYPPYWLATAAMLAGYLLLDGAFSRQAGDLNVPASLALWPVGGPPVLVVGWTLIHEMYFYLVFAALLLAPRRWLPALLAVWIATAALAGALLAPGSAPVLHLITHPLTAEFVLGCGAGLLAASGRRAFALPSIGLGVVWWLAATILIDWSPGAIPPAGWDRVAAFGIPAAFIVYGVAGLDLDTASRPSRVLIRLGDWSYALYLIHLPLVAALARVWAAVLPEGGVVGSVGYLVTGAAISIAAAGLMHRLFEQPVLRLTRKAGDRLFPAARPVAQTPREATKIW
ncbi:MAG: acyltransferase [Oceanicaulis sp.]